MGRFWVTFVALVTATALVTSEVVPFSVCPDVTNDQCTVSNVKIDPCREAPNACRLRKGRDASITFDFVPKFTAQRLKTEAYWANGAMEPKFSELDPDGCKCTVCPTQPEANATFNYTLHVGKKLPKGSFLIKWKLWNEDNESQVCCFMTNISLRA